MTTPSPNSTPDQVAESISWRDFLPCLWMLLGVVAVFPLFAAYGYTRFEINGVIAAAAAASVVLLGMEIALVVTILFRNTEMAVAAILGGTISQTGIPLVFGLLMRTAGGPLAESGLFGMILVYYLLCLAAKTILAVQLVSQTSLIRKAA